jgi:predicted RNA-binding protein
MCLAKACIGENGEEKLIMEEITLVEVEDETLFLNSLFGEQKKIEAHIKKIDFMSHSITLEKPRRWR